MGNAPSGALLLKVIIGTAHTDTRATTAHIKSLLSSLDKKMISLSSNIEEFNNYVRDQLSSLLARGATTSDLIENLFKGYLTCQDNEFVTHIRIKKRA